MKKVGMLFTMLLCVALKSYCYPIFQMTKHGGGIFGYRDVDATVSENSNGTHGWVITCSGRGFAKCIAPPGVYGGVGDANDYEASLSLLEHADSEMNNRILTGSYVMNIQVSSEQSLRVYTVTWNCDEAGNGTIVVDRVDQ